MAIAVIPNVSIQRYMQTPALIAAMTNVLTYSQTQTIVVHAFSRSVLDIIRITHNY